MPKLADMMLAARYPTSGDEAGVIRVERIERPRPDFGEVLVEVAVSGVNPTDWKVRRSPPAASFPWVVPNQDGAGVIVDVGEGVPAARIGERVWLWLAQWRRAFGTAAQYVALPGAQAVPLPPDAAFDLGAGLGVPALTAAHCLVDDGPLAIGDRVLVHGGAGAVGHAAIELARLGGAHVAATVSNDEKAALAAAAGAELVIDYTREDVAARVRDWAPDGVKRIIEVNISRNLELDAKVIARGGSILVYAVQPEPARILRELMAANARIQFMLLYTIPEDAKQTAVAHVTTALEAGALTELPATRFALADTAAAHDAVERGAVGKVLIDVRAAEEP